MSCEKALKQATAQLGKKGYHRSAGAVSIHWYTKLRHSYPIQLAQEDTDDIDESDGPASLSDKVAAVSKRSNQGLFSGPKSNFDVLGLKMPQLDPEHSQLQSTLLSDCSYRDPLPAVCLGGTSKTGKRSGAAIEVLRACAGRRFDVEKTWTGASNDILDAAWSPDGTQYIICCAAMEHPYNRPNNLLLGNVVRSELWPGHREVSAISTTRLLDPWTYHTVGNVSWSGNNIYTAGYDGVVQVWDANDPTKWKYTMEHDGRVETMAVSNILDSLLATATDSGLHSLRLYPDPASGCEGLQLSLPQKTNIPFSYTPMCMEFGLTPQYSNHLLVGFGSSSTFDDGPLSPRGSLGLWRMDEGQVNRIQLNPCSQQVFDVALSQQSNLFKSGNTIGKRIGGVGATLVRIYDCGRSNVKEAACPALDINDISICGFDERIFSTPCTNGKVYVWNMRSLASPLHILEHGPNVSGHTSELNDSGVRVVQWGNDRKELFTGGSDGVLNLWDIRQGVEDVLTDMWSAVG